MVSQFIQLLPFLDFDGNQKKVGKTVTNLYFRKIITQIKDDIYFMYEVDWHKIIIDLLPTVFKLEVLP